MEKPTKTERCMLMIVAALVILAWLVRLLGIPWEGGCNPIRAVIYPVLFLYWGMTLNHRLIHPQVRHFAVSTAGLMLFWFIPRTIKYAISDIVTLHLIRYLWYLYYIPMLYIPLLTLMMALSIGRPETQRLPKKYNVLWFLTTALVLLVLTNDLHQLVFVFPDNGEIWSDRDYSYSIGYYAVAAFMILINLITFIIMEWKSRRRRGRLKTVLPVVPIFLMLCYWALYIIQVPWLRVLFGDLPAVCCVLYGTELELCIRCGLILSNSGYERLFRASRLGAQITDRGNTVRIAGADAVPLTEEQMLGARAQPMMIDKTTLLRSGTIFFGHVLWQEDVAELTEAIDEYEENCRDLEERSRIRRENLEAGKTILALQEKNRAADLLQRETAGQLERIDSLLSRYSAETDEAERRRLLAGAAVVGSYIKRYGNLLLVHERNDTADTADLARCFEESFLNLELLGVDCLCSLPQNRLLKTEDMLRIYRAFETALEDCLFELHSVWINGRERDGRIILNIEFACDTDLSRHAPEADAFSSESGASRFTFRVQKGGAEE